MNPYELLRSIYEKTKPQVTGLETWHNIQLCKWLSQNTIITSTVARLIPYMFYVEPAHFFYLLWFSVPKQAMVHPPKKVTVDMNDSLLLNKVQDILQWSPREMELNKSVLNHVLKDEQYWIEQLGVTK